MRKALGTIYMKCDLVNATTIIETNQWPRVVGITGKSGKSTEGLYE